MAFHFFPHCFFWNSALFRGKLLMVGKVLYLFRSLVQPGWSAGCWEASGTDLMCFICSWTLVEANIYCRKTVISQNMERKHETTLKYKKLYRSFHRKGSSVTDISWFWKLVFSISCCHSFQNPLGMPVFLHASFCFFPLPGVSISILNYLDNLKYENAAYHTYCIFFYKEFF